MTRQNLLRRIRRSAPSAALCAVLCLAGLPVVLPAALAGAGRTATPPKSPPGHHVVLTVPERAPVSLYYEEQGRGPTVLLLHGLGESSFTWYEIVPRLAERHRVIALDLKGFGRSEKPHDEDYTADDQAALVARFIVAMKLDGVSLVGHSFGGTVALKTALAPEIIGTQRVRRIAAIGAPALPGSTAPHLDLVKLPAVPDLVAQALSPEFLARVLLREAMGGKDDVNEQTIEGYAAPYREPEAMHAFLATARSIVEEKDEKAVAKRLKQLSLPVLVVWCRKDPIVPLRAGRKLAATLPSARLRIIDGCHHLPQHERPGALVKVLRPFLRNR